MKYNRALRRRFKKGQNVDPILLDDIDESNEWLMGRMEDNGSDGDEEYVFNDDCNLTWEQVGRASGANDPSYHTRASRIRDSAGPSSRDKGKAIASGSAPRISQKFVLVDDDEEVEEDVVGDDEEYKVDSDEAQYDDDDDLVDLE